MNYRIDIDELYGIKHRKVSRFQSGGIIRNFLEYYTNPNNPTRTYVLFDAARRANLPFMYDVGNGGLFDYTIASDNPNNIPGSIHTNTMNGNWFDPNTTYLEIDPQTGLIMNGQNGDVVFNGQMNPIIEGNYYYDDNVGWTQTPSYRQAEIYPTEKAERAETYRNVLSNLGFEHAWRMDDDSVLDFGNAVGLSMATGAVSELGGQLLNGIIGITTKAPWLTNLVTRYPRLAATSTAIGTQVLPGIAAGVQDSQEIDRMRQERMSAAVKEIDDHMKGISYFTEENFNRLHGVENIPNMIEWLSQNGYNVAKLSDGTYTIEKDYFMFPWLTDDLLQFWPTAVGLGSIYASRRKASANEQKLLEQNGQSQNKKGTLFKNPDGTRTKWGRAKNALGYVSQIGATLGLQYYESFQRKMNEKAAQMADFLVRKGYARFGTPYTVQQQDSYAPAVVIPGTDTISGVPDSAATVQDYSTGQMDSTYSSSDSINENANIFKYQQPATINE